MRVKAPPTKQTVTDSPPEIIRVPRSFYEEDMYNFASGKVATSTPKKNGSVKSRNNKNGKKGGGGGIAKRNLKYDDDDGSSDSGDELEDLFVPVPPSPSTSKKHLKRKSKSENGRKAKKLKMLMPQRNILYPVGDPRGNDPDAILRCEICDQQGTMHLYLDEEGLQHHRMKHHRAEMETPPLAE